MAETKIEIEDVRVAYRELHSVMGRRPGLQLMRKQLGGGSFSRIKRLLDQVEAEEHKLTTPEKPLPDPLAKLVFQIYEEVDNAADASIEDRSKAFEEAEAEFNKQMAAKDEELAQLKVDLAQSEDKRGQMEARIQILVEDLQAEQKETTVLEAERDNLMAKLEQLEPRIEELKSANIKQTQATEIMRADMAIQIKEAQNTATAAREEAELRLNNQQQQHDIILEGKDKEISKLQGLVLGYEGRIEGLKDQVTQAREDADRRIEEKTESDHQVIRLEGQLSQLRSENHQLTQNISKILEKLAKSEAALVSSTETITEQKIVMAKHEEANRIQQETIDQLKKELINKNAPPA